VPESGHAVVRADSDRAALGHAVAGFDAALSYAKRREQFGRPLASWRGRLRIRHVG
jgi:glutaryl-CoA dehydrogenase